MAEEFQESEVFYSAGYETEYSDDGRESSQSSCRNNNNKKLKRKNKNTAPVTIPGSISSTWVQYVEPDFFDDVEIVPPHVIIGRRRVASKMAFSVCSGNGRTLKGRDLSQVRNSVLRMTGFLES